MRNIFHFLMIFLLITILGCSQNAILKKEPIQLAQSFEEGMISKYNIQTTSIYTTIFQGSSHDQNISMNIDILNKVEKIVEDTIFLKLSIENINGSTRILESIKPLPDIEKLKGKSAIIKLSVSGEILEIETDEELSFSESPTEIEGFIRPLYGFLPDKKIKNGDIWEKKYEEKGIAKHSTYTLSGFQLDKNGNEIAIITSKSEVTIEKDIEEKNAKIKMQMSGTVKGRIYCSVSDGFITKVKLHTAMEGTANIESSMGNFESPIYINDDTEIKRIK